MRDKLLQQQKSSEASLAKVHEARKQQQLRNLKEKMAQRRKNRLDKLRDEQERYRTEVSLRTLTYPLCQTTANIA